MSYIFVSSLNYQTTRNMQKHHRNRNSIAALPEENCAVLKSSHAVFLGQSQKGATRPHVHLLSRGPTAKLLSTARENSRLQRQEDLIDQQDVALHTQ